MPKTTEDLVNSLRELAPNKSHLFDEAADRLESLEKEVERLRKMLDELGGDE